MARRRPIALTLVTGFLGAGKTTLVNRLLKDPALVDTAVVVNEFGEVAIDHFLVEQASDGVIELGDGCLCCTVRGALIDTLVALAERPGRPQRVVVETTGLAEPAPILQAVAAHPLLSRLFRPEAVVTVVDAVNGPATLEAHHEAVNQVAIADRIVVTKAALADEPIGKTLLPRLAALNGQAEILDGDDPAAQTADVLLRPGFAGSRAAGEAPQEHDHHHHDHHDHSRFASVSLIHEAPLPFSAVENFLDLVATQQAGRILRIKGLVETPDDPDRPVVVQGAQRILHAPERLARWPEGAPRGTRLVLIGQDLDTDYVRRVFAAFAGRPAVDTPDRTAIEDNPLSIPGFRP